MNKILLFFLFTAPTLSSCVKEQLVIVDKELEFDENSPEYQAYQAERAMTYIRTYRFEKIGNVLEKITDSGIRKNLLDSLSKYRGIAETKAFFIVKENKDTLFFFPPVNNNPTLQDEVVLGAHFRSGVMGPEMEMKDSKGIVDGLKNFPKTTYFRFYNTLATEIKGLEQLSELKKFEWVLVQADIETELPEENFKPIPLRADFSKNPKLEEMIVSNIELGHITYPDHQLKKITQTGAIRSGNIDGLWAKEASIYSYIWADGPEFAIRNSKIDKLSIGGSIAKTLNIQEAQIKRLQVPTLEKLVLNDKLEELILNAKNLKEKPNYPTTLQRLVLNQYLLEPDFSALSALDSLSLSFSTDDSYTGAPQLVVFKTNSLKLPANLRSIDLMASGYYTFDVNAMQLPSSLQSIRFSGTIEQGTLDLSSLSNLKEVTLYTSRLKDNVIKLPSHVEKIDFSTSLLHIKTLDLSALTHIKYLDLGTLGTGDYSTGLVPVTLILPTNLSEQVFSGFSSNSKPVNLKSGSTIINKPSWFDKYVNYVN